MNTRLHRKAFAAFVAAGVMALAGCGGGDKGDAGQAGPQGPAGPPGPSGATVTVASNAAPATQASAAAWAALAPKVTVTSVTIASPPVVRFTVTDANGAPVVGLGNTRKRSSDFLPGLTNLAFAMAKLVPGTNGSPSQWVSYMVTTVAATPAPTRPGTDNNGTLVDNGDGTYQYTFYRDVPQIKAQVAAMTVSGSNNKADLGDLTYEPNLVHRLTIQVSGEAPGTGTNTPNGVAFSTEPGVQLVKATDAIYDFIPATGQAVTDSGRDIVATAKCAECHRVLGGIPGDDPESSGAGFHGGARNETRYCVVCHTEQRKYGYTESAYDPNTLTFTGATVSTRRVDGRAVGNLPNHIHKTHMGKLLAKKNYDYAGVTYNEVLFPQDIRNCTKCHDGSNASTAKTAQGDNWKNVPNRLACGGCHDGINFATGQGVTIADAAKGLTSTTSHNGFAHGGLAQADDSLCAQCHTSTAIDLAHLPVTPPNATSALHVAGGSANTNSAWIASNTSRLPAGAIKVSYQIKSVSAVADGGGIKRPRMVFRMLQNGARADLNVHDTTTPSPVTGKREIWDGFMGAPSLQFVYAVPQDNVTTPADFNAAVSAYLRCLWNGTAQTPDPNECISPGTLTGPDSDGYYTATLTGAVVPDNAVMLTGGIGFSYNVRNTMPLTQVNLANYPTSASPVAVGATDATATSTQLLPSMPNRTGGLIVIAPNAQMVASTGCVDASPTPTGVCLGSNGAAAASGAFAGRRPIVEDARCNKCHQELGTFTEESFHGGQRNDGTTCAWCHTPNRTSAGWSADSTSFIHAIHAGAKRTVAFNWHAASPTENFSEVKFPGVLKDCETCHLPGTYSFAASGSANAVPNRLHRTTATGTLASASTTAFTFSPYITKDLNYGAGFSFNATTGATTAAAATTLVNSPIAGVCFACHDSPLAKAHMEVNQGSIYATRSIALTTVETCMVCHDTGRIADIKVMHAK